MSKTHKRIDGKKVPQLQRALEQWHKELVDLGVRVGVLMTWPDMDQNGNPKGAAVMHGGHPAAALCKIQNGKNRALHGWDVLIEVDAHLYEDELEDVQRLALWDHELTHVQIVTKGGQPELHDDGRPKLTARKDDWFLTGFYEVVQRHKEAALEARSLANVAAGVQSTFDFMKLSA